MITVENLTKKFGEVTAVEGLTFQIEEGEVFGFLGPNGAGKTTTRENALLPDIQDQRNGQDRRLRHR